MADSNITKKALAGALKELMEETSFSRISVADICERCNMNRKSFYYHFRDKYDLMNWIFDIEFFKVLEKAPVYDTWVFIKNLCVCFEQNRKFYRSALQVQGQNSFEEHFIELLRPVVVTIIKDKIKDVEITDFHIDFCLDAYFGSIKRWIFDRNALTANEFVELLKSCVYMFAEGCEKDM